MLAEVYTGSRPGRPLVLLLVSAAALVGALGLAYVQVREKRALGPEQRLGNTALFFRPPAHWIADPERPGEFYLPLHPEDRGTRSPLERRVRFLYRRLGEFVAPETIIQALDLNRGEVTDVVRTSLAGLPAVQAFRAKPTPVAGRVVRVQTALRVACSPGGDEVLVEYTPYLEFTYADLDLMDDLCTNARLEGREGATRVADALARAGVSMPLPPNTPVSLPEFADVSGFYLGGDLKDLPRYSIGVFRTWLPAPRTPSQLVREFANQRWQVWADALRSESAKRADGAALAWIRNVGPRGVEDPVRSVGVVSRSPADTIILFVFCDEEFADAADAAARALAEKIDFGPSPLPNLVEASASAAELVTRMQTGLLATGWWGRGDAEHFYGRGPGAVEYGLKRVRSGLGTNSTKGFKGFEIFATNGSANAMNAKRDSWRWQIDSAAGAYTHDWRFEFGARGLSRPVEISESRSGPSAQIVRTITIGREHGVTKFDVGPTFVPPPLETLVVQDTATKTRGTARLYEQSAPASEGTHFVFVRNVGTDANGRTLVLYQDDFWPPGVRYAHNAAGELEEIQFAGGLTMERNTAAIERRLRGLGGEP